MKKQATFVSPNDAKYRNGRYSLLVIVILSAVNLISVALAGVYYIFSAYLPLVTVSIGYEIYSESDVLAFYIAAVIIALLLILPYLLCYIFSKKKVGWMIGALVLFGVDSLLFLIDFVSFVAAGDYTMILDLVIRVIAIVSLALGVKYGLKAEKEPSPEDMIYSDVNIDENADSLEEVPTVERIVTVTRKKSFAASAVPFVCCVNGKEVARIKNGQSQSFTVNSNAFSLGVMMANGLGSTEILVPAGTDPLDYTVITKMGFSSANLSIVPTEQVK